MWRKIDVLVPPFLKKLDHQLLINYPAIWATRVHYLLFVAGLLGFMFMVLIVMQPIKLYDIPGLYDHVWPILIPLSMIFIIWLAQARKFQLSHQFGDQPFGQKLKVQYAFAVGILSLALAVLLTIPVKVWKVQQTISEQEFAEDYEIAQEALEVYERFFSIELTTISNEELEKSRRALKQNEFLQLFKDDDYIEFCNKVTDVLSKYTGREIPFSPEELERVSLLLLDLIKEKDFEQRWAAINLIYQTIEDRSFEVSEQFSTLNIYYGPKLIQETKDILHTVFFSIFVIWLFSMLYLKQGPKNFFFQFIGLTIIGTLAVPFFLIFEDNFRSDELFLSCWYLSFMIACLIQAFRSRNSAGMIRMKRIALGTAVLATPLLPAVLHEMLTYHETNPVGKMIYMLYFGAFLTFVLWNLIYAKRFEALTAAPREN